VISKTAVAVIFFCACVPMPALAQEPDIGSLAKGVVLEHEGQKGIWLSLDAHRLVLADVKVLGKTRTRVRLLEDKLVLREEQMGDLRLAASHSKDMATAATTALSASERRVRETAEERDAWHRAPLLWLGVGFLAGLGAALAAAKLAQK
jgi:hypothetical protein